MGVLGKNNKSVGVNEIQYLPSTTLPIFFLVRGVVSRCSRERFPLWSGRRFFCLLPPLSDNP